MSESDSPTECPLEPNGIPYPVGREISTTTVEESLEEPNTITSLPNPAPTSPHADSGPCDAVETSNTDSGVSSLTSDSPLGSTSRSTSTSQQPLPPPPPPCSGGGEEGGILGLDIEGGAVEGQEDCGDGACTASAAVEKLTVDIKTGGESSSEGGSRCSSSMGYLEPRPLQIEATPPREVQQSLLDKIQGLSATGLSGRDGSPGAASVESSTTSGSSSQSPTQRRHSLNAPAYKGRHSKTLSLGSMFRKKRVSFVSDAEHTTQTLAAGSTTALILHDRPKDLPAKSAVEEKRHQRMFEQMMAAARKKELQNARDKIRQEKERRQKDKKVDDNLKEWTRVLPNWESQHKTRKVQELWWRGLPPVVRGEVWQRAIGNDLNISPELYWIFLSRCKEKLASMEERRRSDSNASQKSLSREHSVEVIHLDVIRTFPTLGFFQEGGPYNRSLHDVLGAYACYRPDIGYVQGMSFLAAVLLLNMEAAEAFMCLANLLNRASYLAFFRVDYTKMRPYFEAFNFFLQETIPKLSVHFAQIEFSPEYYLIEWVFTIYTRVLPLDLACRVWDLFCRDGESFLFRTALGILRLYQSKLLELATIEDAGSFLGRLPSDIHAETLFHSIAAISLSSRHFAETVLQYQQQASPS